MKNTILNLGKAERFSEEFKEKDSGEIVMKVCLVTLPFACAVFLLYLIIRFGFHPGEGYAGGRLFDDPVSGFRCYLVEETVPVSGRFMGNRDQGIMVVNIINANSVTDGCLQIPAYIGGIPVVSVNLGSIYELKTRRIQVTSVQIPESVIIIRRLQLEDVQEVTGCVNVREIYMEAFSCCENLTHIELGNKLEEIQSCAFENCTGLKEICFGNNLRYIGHEAFAGCTSLERVEFSYGSMLGINKDAFVNTPWSESTVGRQILKEGL